MISSKIVVVCALALDFVDALRLGVNSQYHITVPRMPLEQCTGCQQIESLNVDASSQVASAVIEKALQKIEGKRNFPAEWSNGSNFYLLDTQRATSEIYEGAAELPRRMNYSLHQKVPVTLIGPGGESTILIDMRLPGGITSEQLREILGPLENFQFTNEEGEAVRPDERYQVPIAEASTITATRTAEAGVSEQAAVVPGSDLETLRDIQLEICGTLPCMQHYFNLESSHVCTGELQERCEELQESCEEAIREMREEIRRRESTWTGFHVRERIGNQLRRAGRRARNNEYVDLGIEALCTAAQVAGTVAALLG